MSPPVCASKDRAAQSIPRPGIRTEQPWEEEVKKNVGTYLSRIQPVLCAPSVPIPQPTPPWQRSQCSQSRPVRAEPASPLLHSHLPRDEVVDKGQSCLSNHHPGVWAAPPAGRGAPGGTSLGAQPAKSLTSKPQTCEQQ